MAHLDEVNRCHERGLTIERAAQGRVLLRFIIGGTGRVVASGIASSTYPVESVPACLALAARGWRFPAPWGGGTVTVNYPFNLLPLDEEPSE